MFSNRPRTQFFSNRVFRYIILSFLKIFCPYQKMNPFPQPKCCLPEKLLSSEQQTHFVRLSVFEISRTKSSTTKWWKLVHSSTYQKLSDWPGRIRAQVKACKRTDCGTFLKSVS